MNVEVLREYCLSKKNSRESFPFNEDTLVFKVSGKIFALIALEKTVNITLKCLPEKSIELREKYTGITPAYHMNKTHWISLDLTSFIPEDLVYELIDLSYDLVNKVKK
ncbi:MAG: MmcQ/YjbR family DNA-binding protein [Bacteroidales bacterium]|jgi:predicted DNA-binding protein (MmcQ/YjbR family)|nr:MmcQ/YjbR family DNA-binding protein [Bacteroidales bacterium]HOL98709.1 MmcQ/YjbR family DNA-binding protein [Bacteroidales bacterium]HOM36983.1 MmcQ/YjbR family DNA-binding protein [Bacteroidales bacterium]HPD24594.1 MmcQ/YjbR family DNA-binding protein [Bacteroidales bacterium]HRT00382.1 MmcQ/YjbR family DNA-binding protein [Bacteroidales bacterium]